MYSDGILTRDEFDAEVRRCADDAYSLELMERRANGIHISDDLIVFAGTEQEQMTARAIVNAVKS